MGFVANFFQRRPDMRTHLRFTPRASRPREEERVDPQYEAVVEAWRDECAALTATCGGADSPTLTIFPAHPGGLAQLLAEHPTRLSALLREPHARARAYDRALAVIAQAEELSAHHGMAEICLGLGQASWLRNGQKTTVPVFLRPLHLERLEDDVTLTLRPGMIVTPLLERELAAQGALPDVEAIVAEATGSRGFSPSSALAAIKESVSLLADAHIVDDLVVGVFQHPSAQLLEDLAEPRRLLSSELVAALAGDQGARENFLVSLPSPNPHDRDPWEEIGVGDLSPRQQDVVEAASARRSLVIDVPAGADETGVLSGILADAAAKGRTCLHVAPSAGRIARVQARLQDLGLDEIFAKIDVSDASAKQLRERVRHALTHTSTTGDRGQVDAMRQRLVAVRQVLANHTEQLHAPFREFGVSAHDALQVLTDLTGTHPSPRTRVRLGEKVLLDIASDQGERARHLLHSAAAVGVFSPAGDRGPWNGVVINASEHVGEVLTRVSRLAGQTLPALRVRMGTVQHETGLRPVGTLAQWEEQLAMFAQVREVLDVFLPRVFERSAADMVIATAPRQWRKDRGVTMPRSQRLRLIRQARELVRPDVEVKDVHEALLLVQERRDLWREHCGADGWPTIPQNFEEIVALTAQVRADVEQLAPVFATSHPDMLHMPLTDLGRLLERLDADHASAYALPEKVAALKRLSTLGLDEFVKDLRQRRVAEELIDAELDLAWWASVLGLMIAEEPGLGGFDPVHLEDALAEGRRLDVAQVHSLAPQVIDRVRQARCEAIARDPLACSSVEKDLEAGLSAPHMWARNPILSSLMPVVLTVPPLVPLLLPREVSEARTRGGIAREPQVDLLILDGIDGLSLSEIVPLVARARQVIVLADVTASRQAGPVAAFAAILPVLRMETRADRLNDQVALLLARHGISHSGVPVPWSSASAPVNAVWTNGTGMPAPGTSCVESSAQEVDQVVELVLAHAVEQPERSLAVVALNQRHAQRLTRAVERALSGQPALAEFFSPAKIEPFVIVDPVGATGLGRDRIIMSVGFAKTPHGRVLHDFADLSGPRGLDLLAGALGAVRGDLTVVSSMRAGEIDRSRVTARGAQLLVDLLELAEGHSGEGAQSWPVLEAEPDRLLVDLAERLYRMGLDVLPNVGVSGGLRVPLAVGHPEVPGRMLVAVLTDDAEYLAEPSLRVRDRLRPAMLEAQGWKVHMALSMPVFIDPAKEAESIVQTVLDAVDEVRGPSEDSLQVPPLVEDEADEDVTFVESVIPHDGPLAAPEIIHDEQASSAGGQDEALATGEGDASAQKSPPRWDEIGANTEDSSQPVVERTARPRVAKGLPLSAYGDDQLDELALWVASDGLMRTHAQMIEELRAELGLTRRGAQTDAVLGNVVRRLGLGSGE